MNLQKKYLIMPIFGIAMVAIPAMEMPIAILGQRIQTIQIYFQH